MEANEKPIGVLQQTIKLAKIVNIMVFILDKHVPETKKMKMSDRLGALDQKILKLKMENAANNKVIDALERLWGMKNDDPAKINAIGVSDTGVA